MSFKYRTENHLGYSDANLISSSMLGISLPSSRQRYRICSLNDFVSSFRTSGTFPLETMALRNGVSCSKIVSSISSYHDSTQMPLSGVVCVKFSARLSIIMVLSKGRPRFLRSLLFFKINSSDFFTLHNHRVAWCAICRVDVWPIHVYQCCPWSNPHTIKLDYLNFTSGIAAVKMTSS